MILRESLKQELCLKGNNETIIWVRGNWKCQTSDLMLLKKYKRKPDTWNKHVVPYLDPEATSFPANTAYPFRLIPWLLELDSDRTAQILSITIITQSSTEQFLLQWKIFYNWESLCGKLSVLKAAAEVAVTVKAMGVSCFPQKVVY